MMRRPACFRCGLADKVIRWGVRRGQQRYQCKHCQTLFSLPAEKHAGGRPRTGFMLVCAGCADVRYARRSHIVRGDGYCRRCASTPPHLHRDSRAIPERFIV